MPRLPRVTAPEIIRVLEKLGFALARQTGAHRVYKNAAGRRTTVSYHAGRTIHPKTLKSILADAGLTVEELIALLKDA
jgi:predicted RNA binding protein YcfA (HicA-like mRNA interferase family)